MGIKKELIYPVFLECCVFTEDNFWQNIFEDLAYGKSPYGTYINKDCLCCNYKKKEFNYLIERKNPEQLYNEIYELLCNKLGLLSKKQKIMKKLELTNMEENLKDCMQSWNNIKIKNIKDLLIQKYVISMREKYGLTMKQAKYLHSTIFTAMVFKVITNKDIKFKDGIITNIDGIDFVKRQIIVKRDLYNIQHNFIPQIILDKKLMFDLWDKYITKIAKLTS
jgi:hypothetical protein|uniref:Uncharacterized protein n=1 Tax=viral metagenome TaxID=1070528 RepID=A0A6C0D1L0_9ZZZZ